ncbi:MAG TPA: S41 family peptidase, partial [Kouleothrix sp.]|nr:S41 family peptidase [Kouleothrix sp.]
TPPEPAPETPPAPEPAPETPPAPEPAPETPPPPLETPPPPPAKPATTRVAIVFEGIERRLRMLTSTNMQTIALCISPDSRDLIFRAMVAGKPNLWSQPLDEPRQDQPPRQLTFTGTSKWAAQFAPDGKSFYYLDNHQAVIRKFPSGDATTMALYSDVTIDFNQEKRQIFDECWRLLRDYFYDPTFRGLNWSAAYSQFGPLAAGAHTGDDLRAILNLMVGELRASHLGAAGSDSQPVPQGYLGLLFDPAAQAASGSLRVAEIIADGPVALANTEGGVGPGDELLAVNGVAIGPGTNIDTLLQRTASRRVVLRFGPRDGGAPRELVVRPIGGGAYTYLRYRAWVYANEEYVHRVSGGRLGYVHIRAMDFPSYQRFLADLDSELYSKEGVVVDTRFNGGGSTGTFILDILARRSVLLSTFRDRPPIDAGYFHGNRVLNKPTILLINEESGSNTEMFAEGYRRLGLGKVVGRPSAGAVIGTLGHTLLDGTRFRLPRIKIATPEGEDLEGTGRAVDIDVAQPIGAWARGSDRQLDAAVAELLAQIDGAA